MAELILALHNDNEIEKMMEIIDKYNSRFNDIQFETEIEYCFSGDDLPTAEMLDDWAHGEEPYAQMSITANQLETCEVEWENLLYSEYQQI